MLNIVLFFFLLDKGGQPIVGGYAEHDYTHDIQQVGEVDNPFNDDKPYAPTGILDGRLFEQLVSPIFVYRPFFRVIRGSFYSQNRRHYRLLCLEQYACGGRSVRCCGVLRTVSEPSEKMN